jgi:hypothetical protein
MARTAKWSRMTTVDLEVIVRIRSDLAQKAPSIPESKDVSSSSPQNNPKNGIIRSLTYDSIPENVTPRSRIFGSGDTKPG